MDFHIPSPKCPPDSCFIQPDRKSKTACEHRLIYGSLRILFSDFSHIGILKSSRKAAVFPGSEAPSSMHLHRLENINIVFLNSEKALQMR